MTQPLQRGKEDFAESLLRMDIDEQWMLGQTRADFPEAVIAERHAQINFAIHRLGQAKEFHRRLRQMGVIGAAQ